MCIQVPCVYLLYAASTVTIRNNRYTVILPIKNCLTALVVILKHVHTKVSTSDPNHEKNLVLIAITFFLKKYR